VEDHWERGTHPFTIGTRHVVHASDNHSGMLGEATLRAIPCAARNCGKAYDNPVHKSIKIAMLDVAAGVTQDEYSQWAGGFQSVGAGLVSGVGFPGDGLKHLKKAGIAR